MRKSRACTPNPRSCSCACRDNHPDRFGAYLGPTRMYVFAFSPIETSDPLFSGPASIHEGFGSLTQILFKIVSCRLIVDHNPLPKQILLVEAFATHAYNSKKIAERD